MGEKLSEMREILDESKETTGEARRWQEKQGDLREKVESVKRAKTGGGESGSKSLEGPGKSLPEGMKTVALAQGDRRVSAGPMVNELGRPEDDHQALM